MRGRRAMCAIAISAMVAASLLVWSATEGAAAAPAGDPVGSLDAVEVRESGVDLRGWAADPDTPGQPVELHVYVDGIRTVWFGDPRLQGPKYTGKPRPDVASAFPWAGASTGFVISLRQWLDTAREVCVYAIDQGGGTQNTTLGCRAVHGPANGNPVGSFDLVSATDGAVRVQGWAMDPDAAIVELRVGQLIPASGPIPVDVWRIGRITTGLARPDVAAAVPGVGSATGFDETMFLPSGPRIVCVTAINAGPGDANPLLGCKSILVPGTVPRTSGVVGNLDAMFFESEHPSGAIVANTQRVAGWAFDPAHPDDPVTIRVRYYHTVIDEVIDGTAYGRGGYPLSVVGSTGVPRPDVASSVSGAGPNQGFLVDVPNDERVVDSTLAIYAVDRNGNETLLGYQKGITEPPR